MKAVAMVKNGNLQTGELGQVDVIDVPMPDVGEEDVLVKVSYASICGSDPHIMRGGFEVPLPLVLGHEMSGVVEKVGPRATTKGLQVGDRVTGNFVRFCGTCYYCRNGQENLCHVTWEFNRPAMAEYVAWHESQLYKIPDSVDLIDACLTEPLAIALHAVERGELRIGARVAVSGAGGIGLMIVQLAKMAGASSVTVIEPVEEKRKLAKQLGADYEIDPEAQDTIAECMKITAGLGFDVVIESSGASSAATMALDILARGGCVVYFAMNNPAYEMPLNLFQHCYLKGIKIHGMFMSPYSFPRTVAMLPRMQLKPLIQKVYPMDECKKAFDDQISGKFAKIVFKCS